MNHITGGGFMKIFSFIARWIICRNKCKCISTPAIFDWLQEQGNISTDEMYNIFNMGIGFTVIVDEIEKDKTMDILKQQCECL